MRTLIYSNIYISVAAALLAKGTNRLLGVEANSLALTALVFFATLSVYNLDRLIGAFHEDRLLQTERHRWLGEHRRWSLGLFGVGLCGVLGSLFFLQSTTIIALLPLGLISLSYCVPLLFRRAPTTDSEPSPRLRLKEVPGSKTFFIALVWAAVTVLLPAIEAGVAVLERQVLIVFWERWLFVFALTLPFDIRDVERDRSAGIKTLAVIFGPRRTIALSLTLMALFSVVTAARYTITADPLLLGIALSGVITAVALLVGRPASPGKERGELYYTGWLDGMLLLQAAILLAL